MRISRGLAIRYALGVFGSLALGYTIFQVGYAYQLSVEPLYQSLNYDFHYYWNRLPLILLIGIVTAIIANLVAIRMDYAENPNRLTATTAIAGVIGTGALIAWQDTTSSHLALYPNLLYFLFEDCGFFFLIGGPAFLLTFVLTNIITHATVKSRSARDIMPEELKRELDAKHNKQRKAS